MELSDYQQKNIEESVKDITYNKVGKKTTVAVLTTYSGFEIVGSSACVNVEEYDREIGNHYALVDGLKKLDELEGYLRQEKQANMGVSLEKCGDAQDVPDPSESVFDKYDKALHLTKLAELYQANGDGKNFDKVTDELKSMLIKE